MLIGSNLAALNISRHVQNQDQTLGRTIQRMSSGYRIAITADDPTGQSMAQRMRSQSQSMNQAARNGQDTLSLLQTAEGGMEEMQAVLHRMRELSVQAASDDLNQWDRWQIQKEIDELKEELNHIANSTQYNGMSLLSGNQSPITDSEQAEVFIRDSISEIDPFGTVQSDAGNYRLKVEAQAGRGQVQKSHSMTLKDSQGEDTVASLDTELKDIDSFYDSQGNFVLQEPRLLTLLQGNDQRSTISIDGSQTVEDLQNAMNTVIARDFNQQDLLAQGSTDEKFVRFVEEGKGGHEGVAGTFVLQSAEAGGQGEISFLGDEDLIQALGFTTLEQSREHQYKVQVQDSHTGDVIKEHEEVSGTFLSGVVHENVDIRIQNNTGVEVHWDEDMGTFVFADGSALQETIDIHLNETSRFFHLGANPFQGIAIAIGDLRAEALNVDTIMVMNQEHVPGALKAIDRAIEMVGEARGKVGALQNRVEHAINYLQESTLNIITAQSRIKDADMAKEMLEFTKKQIIVQAGTSMLLQANLRPQAVLELLE